MTDKNFCGRYFFYWTNCMVGMIVDKLAGIVIPFLMSVGEKQAQYR